MKIKKLLLFLYIAGVAVSCTTEPSAQSGSTRGKSISVTVSGSDGISTRSGAADGELFDSFVIGQTGGRELKIDAYVSDFNPDSRDVDTKGAIITAGYLQDTLKKFYLEAYAHGEWYDNTLPDGTAGSESNKHEAGCYFSPNPTTNEANVTYGTGGWSIFGEPDWINSVDMSFWSWNAAGISLSIDTLATTGKPAYNQARFKYTNDGQNDLIFAYNAEKRAFDAKGDVTGGSGTKNGANFNANMDITFHHALAAVRFDVSGLKAKGFQIDSVYFSGIYSEGSCSVIGADDRTVTFAWDSLGTDVISQALDSADFTQPGLDTAQTAKALMPLDSKKFLFFIPQTVKGKSVKIKVVYSDDKGNKTRSEVALDHDKAWEAGKYYTYKLSIKKGLSVTVDDDLSDNVKNNLSIKYDGDTLAYIRASIVAYWVDASGNFLSNCDYKNQGTLEGLATGDWSENTADGFFYYTEKVEPGTDAGPSLLKSYTPPTPPIDGAILRMVIAAQATKYNENKTCVQAFSKE